MHISLRKGMVSGADEMSHLDTEQSVFAISTYQSTILQANSHDDKPVTCFMLSKPMKDGVEEKNSF